MSNVPLTPRVCVSSKPELGAEAALKPRQTRREARIPTDTGFLNPKIHLLFFKIKLKKKGLPLFVRKRETLHLLVHFSNTATIRSGLAQSQEPTAPSRSHMDSRDEAPEPSAAISWDVC